MEEVLTAEEVAGYLRLHLMTVRRWCRSGSLPAAKIGRAYRIKKSDLEAWWAEHSAGEQSGHEDRANALRPGNQEHGNNSGTGSEA